MLVIAYKAYEKQKLKFLLLRQYQYGKCNKAVVKIQLDAVKMVKNIILCAAS